MTFGQNWIRPLVRIVKDLWSELGKDLWLELGKDLWVELDKTFG